MLEWKNNRVLFGFKAADDLGKPDILYMRIEVVFEVVILTKNVVIACMYLTMCLLFTAFTAFTWVRHNVNVMLLMYSYRAVDGV